MTVRELHEEIETRLMGNPQNAVELSEAIGMETDASEADALHGIRELLAAGWLIAIDGLLYLQAQAPDPPEAA